MDTQNTPIHIKLWHHDFWRLCFANLLLMMSSYMLIVGIPYYMFSEGYSHLQVGEVMGIYGLGIFLLGGFCSYLVQRCRRNHVCLFAMAGVVVSIFLLCYFEEFWGVKPEFWGILLSRLAMGAFLGLAQMTLGSTLIIDTCESFQRTEANYITSWFARFALPAGPLLAVTLGAFGGFKFIFPVSALLTLLALVLVSLVKFPFKAPTEHMPLFSNDRFFLSQGIPLFINITLIMVVLGMMLSLPHSIEYYMMAFIGMILAVIAEKYVFADADLKSQVVTGLILLGAALLIRISGQVVAIDLVMPCMGGLAIGVIGSRFLLFYIKLAKHCQRGTSVSSFFLAWEFGLSLGLFIGFYMLDTIYKNLKVINYTKPMLDRLDSGLMYTELTLVAISLLLYNFVVHNWYMKHRNR